MDYLYYTGTTGTDFVGFSGDRAVWANLLQGDDLIEASLGDDVLIGGPENPDPNFPYLTDNDRIFGDTRSGQNSNDQIYGGYGNDTLFGDSYFGGGGGNDTIYGGSGNDELFGGDGNDSANGGAGNDTVYGQLGNDYLIGALGNDTLIGGDGNDTYFNVDASDAVIENASQGIDLVFSYYNYTLGANVENLGLDGFSAINGTGNNLDNYIGGNINDNSIYGLLGNDSLKGLDGNDYLDGGEGNDTLYGELGNDYLNGRSGADYMYGGVGNDKYVVDNASDVVIEQVGEGTDTVISTINYTLGTNLENLTLTESAVSGTGNELSNYMLGNAASNTIFAQDGDDTVNGRGGEDFINGGTGNDTLYGDTENDTLVGATGNDLLSGGTGKDAFKFWNSNEGIDTIRDFGVADDLILVDNLGFSGGLTVGTLKANQFHIGTSAQDSSDRFIYNQSTGSLYFDKDGIGGVAQTEFAKLSAGLAMTNQNISVTSFII
ncbi:MAG: calcium-binding protein [Oscillatoriales cyanobacterium RU_3_3]|nr:calcium-binding protein [Microcoleus sp. SM1_3_4]NJM61375.1 calcium-binding protein [Oscillatoriales cyanobacterium RU_3_3]